MYACNGYFNTEINRTVCELSVVQQYIIFTQMPGIFGILNIWDLLEFTFEVLKLLIGIIYGNTTRKTLADKF